ncbi:heterokaryon incompatibility protein-domain-containing protein [Scleroderma yunnanense]
MHLINVQAFIERERKMRLGWPVNRRMKILEFHDDNATDYAILSHRWIDQEVNYDEIAELTKMEKDEQDEIRHRDGYRKILASCEQAERDGYEWLWVDTCCINKRSSAELSEAINSMYRWYQNSSVCYVYFHDVPSTSFPTKPDKRTYPNSDGWPEWFSRGWTLQEMIAPGNVQFFNQNWQSIGDKKVDSPPTVPASLRSCHGLPIGRRTTRVEDRAYSLLGLLDVNMPMLYGEGKKAFQRFQLEIIRVSDDQSIFAWGAGVFGDGGRTGSILADDPSFFRDCGKMELMDRDEFIEEIVKGKIPEEALHSVEDRFGVFPVTNRGIHIGCSSFPWKTQTRAAQFRQIYLRYQDPSAQSDVTFEIDDSAITNNGFTCCSTYRVNDEAEDEGGDDRHTFTLTSIDPLCINVYSDHRNDCCFAVGFGQCLGQDWMHVFYEQPTEKGQLARDPSLAFFDMLSSGPDYAKSMAEARRSYGHHVWVKHFCFPGSTWTIRTSCIVWDRSRNRGAKIEVFQHPYSGPEKWIGFLVEGADDPNCDMQNLMMWQTSLDAYWLKVDGIHFRFSRAPDGTKLGDYGYLTDCEDFRCEGNIFDDLRSLPSKPVVTPKKDRPKDDTDSDGCVIAFNFRLLGDFRLYDPVMLSLPSNDDVNTLLASLSTRFINRYLINRVIECPVPPDEFSSSIMLYKSSDGCESTIPYLGHNIDYWISHHIELYDPSVQLCDAICLVPT